MEESDDEEAPAPTAGQGSEPNPILYIEGLPAELTGDMLSTLFQQYVAFTASPSSLQGNVLTPPS